MIRKGAVIALVTECAESDVEHLQETETADESANVSKVHKQSLGPALVDRNDARDVISDENITQPLTSLGKVSPLLEGLDAESRPK